MPVSGPKCVAEIVFGRSGIARDFFFDEIDDPLQQLRLGMLAESLRVALLQALDFPDQCIERFAKSRMNKEPPGRLWRLFFRHRVTSSGSGSSSLTSTSLVRARASPMRVAA